MVHANAERLERGRLLTTDQWGDYIIYCFYPRQKVFMDGRSDFYGRRPVWTISICSKGLTIGRRFWSDGGSK